MDIASIPDLSLPECLQLVEKHFDAQSIATRSIDQAGVEEYFRQSDRGYRLFHSKQGSMHVALNCEEQFSTKGYLGQVDLLAERMRPLEVSRALEVGCGMGFNTRHLAERLPRCQFIGLDLTVEHIAAAQREARDLANVEFVTGDFQNLHFDDEQFDVVFAVECLCQGNDKSETLREVYRVLRPGGRFLVIDVFRGAPLESYEDDLQLAARLVEKTMAVDEFAVLGNWIEAAGACGFAIHGQTDLSPSISHNVARFYSLARRFFKMPRAARAFLKAFPPRLLENSISGLLMPFSVGSGAHRYYMCELERPAAE